LRTGRRASACYVGLERDEAEAYAALARRVAEEASTSAQPFEAYGAALARVRFAAVFTAHPTFGMSRAVAHALAELASNEGEAAALMAADLSFRPDAAITLQDEFEQARFAVAPCPRRDRPAERGLPGRGAGRAGRSAGASSSHAPCCSPPGSAATPMGAPISAGGDTLRYRLESKRGQFFRLLEKLPGAPATAEVKALVEAAHAAVERQLALCPPLNSKPEIAALQAFSLSLVGEREAALPEVLQAAGGAR
jgi:phosphoenolpyruvate carboxylase